MCKSKVLKPNTPKAIKAYGEFLKAMGFDWENDPHMEGTPRRVVKAWKEDLAKGMYEQPPAITAFPNTEKYDGMVLERNIAVVSMCSHHNLPFVGICHAAYIPGITDEARIIGLSKLNRIVDHFARRPNVQESLTMQIHNYINDTCKGNRGVAVIVEAKHQCVSCRGIKDVSSDMVISKLTGYFFENQVGTRTELFSFLPNKFSEK